MEKGIQIYISKKYEVYIMLYNVLNGGEMRFFGESKYCNKNDLNSDFIYNSIIYLLKINDEDFTNNNHMSEYSLIGYSSFQDLYKKTNLIDLRVENSKIFIYSGIKVKRWYEFDQIDDIGYSENDEDSIYKLSLKLIEIITKY